jgi:hypothetical protein
MYVIMRPKVFVFNPTCEMAVANGHGSYRPPARLRQFEKELAAIPLWLGREKDYVLTEEPVSEAFVDQLKDWGVSAPQFITSLKEVDTSLSPELHPWGWSPAVHQQLKALEPYSGRHPMVPWHVDHRKLLSRYTGLELAEMVAEGLNMDDHLAIPQLPVELNAAEAIADVEAVMVSPMLLKTPWSASGRGLFKIRSRQENAADNPWVLGKLKQQGALLAEPWLEKLQDLSFHFWVEEAGIQFLGTTYFNTDKDGQFLGCYVTPPPIHFLAMNDLNAVVDKAIALLLKVLKKMNLNRRYHGPVGIDALFFKATDGVKLHPCIEINLRYTMGLVNLSISKHLHPDCKGYWTIQRINSDAWQDMQAQNPACLENGKWRKGVFMLTPPPKEEGVMALLNLR